MDREIISSDEAPAAVGPYSQAVRVGQLVYTAGQVGLDPASGELADGTVAQVHQAMRNLQAVLAAAGTDLEHVVKTTIFLADLNDYGDVNEAYGSYFEGAPPARSAVQVARLPLDARVEIEVVATLSDGVE